MFKFISNRSSFPAIFIVLLTLNVQLFAQQYGDKNYYLIDSLQLDLIADYDREILESNLKGYHAEEHDSLKLPFIQNIIEESWDMNIWPRYNDWIFDYSTEKLNSKNITPTEKKFYQQQIAKSLNNKGFLAHEMGDLPTAIYFYNESLMKHIALKDSSEVALLLNNLAGVYELLSNSQKTLDLNFKALEIREALNDELGIAQTCNNIGSIYDNLHKDSIAVNYYLRSYELRLKNNDIFGLTSSTHNLSSIYIDLGKKDSVIYFSNLSIEYCKQINHQLGLGYAYNNLGAVWAKMNVADSAMYYYDLSYKAHLNVGNKRGISMALTNISSSLYGKWMKNGRTPPSLLDQALAKGEEGHQLALELNSPATTSTSAMNMAQIYKEKNNAARTFEMLLLHFQMRDSVNNISFKEAAFEKQTQYEYEKQKAINDLEHEKQLAIEQGYQERQSIIIYFVLGGVIVLIIFIYIIFQRLKITRLQNLKIEKQKAEITIQHKQLEESHKEIKDSITYAKRLQHAILAREESIKSVFPDSFLLYKPKDIVAGDFYFFETTDTHIFYAAADCTGHGVPGAMVSIVCSNALTRCIKEFGIEEPGKILDKTRELVVETFEKSGTDVKDGMDISLISKNKLTGEFKWAGAHNPLWIIESDQVKEIKPDKQPIGKVENPKPFSTHTLQDCTNSILILFTDGYADQFGGEKGKKFKASNLKELLLRCSTKPMQTQKQEINEAFENWRGNLEQIDDVCIIGVRV